MDSCTKASSEAERGEDSTLSALKAIRQSLLEVSPLPEGHLFAVSALETDDEPSPTDSNWLLSDHVPGSRRPSSVTIKPERTAGGSFPASRRSSIFTRLARSHRSQTSLNGVPHDWWITGDAAEVRPWSGVDRPRESVPPEQLECWWRTRKRVREAVAIVLGIAEEALVISSELLQLVPLPGLQAAVVTLIDIWKALQAVDVNRMACLRLIERCATILCSIQEEITAAGDPIKLELTYPIQRLVESFNQVYNFLQKQNRRPFIKRYLKRDEIQRQIVDCDEALSDALGTFTVSIQIRTLKQVLQAERQRTADISSLRDQLQQSLRQTHILPAEPATLDLLQLAETNDLQDLGIIPLAQLMPESPEQVCDTLQAFTVRQNERDLARDTADLRQLMRSAIQARSDVEMIRILQVGRNDVPEAIKALQRALESEVAHDTASADEDTVLLPTSALAAEIGFFHMSPQSNENLQREVGLSGVAASLRNWTSASARSSSYKCTAQKDTLDREFIETGVDALRRLSAMEVSLPSWTITCYEVDMEQKIGFGFFSDVYKGTWKDQVVAIKVLTDITPRKLFICEVNVWMSLSHPNVLKLLGASSTLGEPPWFFVSPYMKNGSLVSYLKGLPSLDSVDLLKMIHEISRGMAYLHSKDVLHGDLKGANVLVDDCGYCVISDFGQSEIKSEVYRLSGTPTPHGTLRWQAPELMAGQSELTQQIDVYAFAICCIEILTKGGLPWPLADDDAVRHFVLRERMRPEVPLVNQLWIPLLSEVIQMCWYWDPSARPSFAKVVMDIQRIRQSLGGDCGDSSRPYTELSYEHRDRSPGTHRVPLAITRLHSDTMAIEATSLSSNDSYRTAHSFQVQSPPSAHSKTRHSIELSDTDDSRSSLGIMLDPPGYRSPPLADERKTEFRDERRYRFLLDHEFHPSLLLPLWTPSQVLLGSIGYLSKPEGKFVTLFNAFKPSDSSAGRMGNMASLESYGCIIKRTQKLGKRSVAQRGMDMIQSWLTSRRDQPQTVVSRKYSFRLRSGHKTARLFTESTAYNYIDDLGGPKRWFKANVDTILNEYGEEHRIGREDFCLVIGTLEAQDHALYVSHSHPDGQVNFNVYLSPPAGQPWGYFDMTTDLSSSMVGGPVYDDSEPEGSQSRANVSAKKVSNVGRGGRWDTVLLARLRFTTDGVEPTAK